MSIPSQAENDKLDDCNIERCTATEQFAIIPNEILQHPTMSANATTVLVYLLSCKPEWVIKPKNVWKAKSLSRNHVYEAFNELIDLGYMERIEEKNGNLRGKTKYRVAYFKKFLRRPESRDTDPRDTESRDALIKKKEKKNDSEKNDERTDVVVPSCIQELSLSDGDKLKFAKLYAKQPERVERAVACLRGYRNPDNPGAIMQQAYNEKWEPRESKDDMRERNIEWKTRKLESMDGKKAKGYTMIVGPDYVEFRADGNADSRIYSVESPKFQECVTDFINRLKG